ncbi:MAG: AAA family ATPase [Bacteroidetes bacterium]|jgi:ABC-type branched-subunit amino acid transport system ATPase component|nr:AAA family ATPase [Bacteroidota bacterium]
MSDLLLDSLEISNFRAFKHLTIERLGRVNLIVGKNNVGKTSLLEAVLLFANRGFPAIVASILRRHDEASFELGRKGSRQWFQSIKHLFHGRPSLRDAPLSLDVKSSSSSLRVQFDFTEESDPPRYRAVPILKITGDGRAKTYDLSQPLDLFEWAEDVPKCLLLTSSSPSNTELAEMWDDIVLAGLEETIVSTLNYIFEGIKGVSFVNTSRFNFSHPDLIGKEESRNGEVHRVPVVKLKHLQEPIPMRSMGDGVLHMLEVALAVANSKGGVALIDEIDSGLHYSVQPDMWRLVFETAARLNVQVFATTHSLDCLRAFQRAASEHDDDGMLISLRRHREEPEKIVAVLADEDDMETIVHSHIEFR